MYCIKWIEKWLLRILVCCGTVAAAAPRAKTLTYQITNVLHKMTSEKWFSKHLALLSPRPPLGGEYMWEEKTKGDFWKKTNVDSWKKSLLSPQLPLGGVLVQIQNLKRELYRDVCPSYLLLKIFNTIVIFWKPKTTPRYPQGNWVPKNHDSADCWECTLEIVLNVENVRPSAFGASFNRILSILTTHEGDQASNIWISRSNDLIVGSFEWRGLRLHTWKLVWKIGDSHKNVFDMYGDSRENWLEGLTVVIFFSPISSVWFLCGIFSAERGKRDVEN